MAAGVHVDVHIKQMKTLDILKVSRKNSERGQLRWRYVYSGTSEERTRLGPAVLSFVERLFFIGGQTKKSFKHITARG